ncbi:MAG: hypothetical protein INR68_04120 [Methylobacterium mesophilicum]|nr:hypothetical protein [Methylobacterium mesophilicum]
MRKLGPFGAACLLVPLMATSGCTRTSDGSIVPAYGVAMAPSPMGSLPVFRPAEAEPAIASYDRFPVAPPPPPMSEPPLRRTYHAAPPRPPRAEHYLYTCNTENNQTRVRMACQ